LPNDRVAPVEDVHRVQRKDSSLLFAVVGVKAGVAKGEPAGTIVGKAGGGFVLETEADIGLAADVSGSVPELPLLMVMARLPGRSKSKGGFVSMAKAAPAGCWEGVARVPAAMPALCG
jgi:hypothetical protein